jgi:signal transduction histidine kinase
VALVIASTIRQLLARIAPRFDSLAARLILAAAVWTAIGLAAGGFVLSNAFTSAEHDNFDTSLQVDLDGMIAAAEPDPNGAVSLQERFLNRRFARVYSGLYWQIVPAKKGAPVQISHSLFDTPIHLQDSTESHGLIWGYAAGPDNQHLRVLGRQVSFPISATARVDDSTTYTFMVAGDLSIVDHEISEFNGTLIWSFVVLVFGLLLAIFIQVRVGLMPLRRLRDALARIRDGSARRLEGKYPAEIAPLVTELNSLIEHSAEVVGRARTHVSNLAHYLKTPLTVLASEAEAHPSPLGDAVKRQVDVMRRQVDHYLVRARAAGALDVLGNSTQISPVLEDLSRVLQRIHERRGITVEVDCPPLLAFRGDRQDIEEMVGNLMDNACKWARATVAVAARKRPDGQVEIDVEDDGPGLAPEDRPRVLERGERLDESVPGSGLGLSIVRDIAKLYGGGLELGESPRGGLRAILILPAIG